MAACAWANEVSPGVLRITTTSLPTARVGQFYSVTVFASGGTPPYTFGFRPATINSLPPGLDGTGAGIISGVPTAAGNYSVQIRVSDSAGASTTLAINLSVLP